MRQGWESEARNWTSFARTPGNDHSHEDINLPALLRSASSAGRRTLDIACGEGRLGRLLASLEYQIVGIDASPTMIQFAVTHQGAAPAVLADATALPFGDAAFDLVVAYMCLHDIDEMPRTVREISRVLEPCGRLCAAIPHPINTAGSFQSHDPTAPFVISGSYLDPTPLTMVTNRGTTRLTFHSEHRPLEAYVQALAAAGLLIETIREVKPPDQVIIDNPDSRRWQRIPLFLHLRAIKPG